MLTAGDVYEVAVTQSFGGSTLINVLHFVLLQNITGAQAKFQAVADDIKEMFRARQASSLAYTGWKSTQVAGAGVTYSATTCRRSGGDVYEGSSTGTLTGGDAAGAPGASTQALVVALKTGLAGRSKRGQVYPGGYDVNRLAAGNRNEWSSTHIANVQTDLNTFLAKYKQIGGTDPNFGWVVWSKFIASGCKYVPAIPKPIYTHYQTGDMPNSFFGVTTATPRIVVVPMRRRKEGRGI
jgi:hypothetical protein